MYFSVKTQGFYIGDALDKDHLPDDCVEVSGDVEASIRSTVMEGNKITSIKGTKLGVEKLNIISTSQKP